MIVQWIIQKTMLIGYIINYSINYVMIMFTYYIRNHTINYDTSHGNNDMIPD